MPPGTILVINCGSSSIKFALVHPDAQAFALSGLAERLGSPDAVLHWQAAGQKHTTAIAAADHRAALAQLLALVQQTAGEQLLG
ncbi:MAG: propionate/acetate kinase, partial [Pseudomonas sp.]|nr:propionate/acetate kinase [Pseudomonas sp.]